MRLIAVLDDVEGNPASNTDPSGEVLIAGALIGAGVDFEGIFDRDALIFKGI